MPAVEFWNVSAPFVGDTVANARAAEDDGWDGLTLGDSQNIVGDVYVEMALAGAATSRLKLAPWVTNPVTRHPAVAAGAIATLQAETGGRVELSIGRGDSALAHLGLAPAPVAVFSHYVERLQRYLRGEDVPFEPDLDGGGRLAPVESLHLGEAPPASRLHWLPPGLPKPPVYVGATGPRVIECGATLADGLIFSVGSDVARVRWAMETSRAARRRAGLSEDGLVYGVHVAVAVDDDRAAARRLASSKVATHARFSVMHGPVVGPASASLEQGLEAVRAAYDMTQHATHGSRQTAVLTDEVVDAFSVAGPPGYCVERLAAIIELGVAKVLVNTTFPGSDPVEMLTSRRRFVTEVLPHLR